MTSRTLYILEMFCCVFFFGGSLLLRSNTKCGSGSRVRDCIIFYCIIFLTLNFNSVETFCFVWCSRRYREWLPKTNAASAATHEGKTGCAGVAFWQSHTFNLHLPTHTAHTSHSALSTKERESARQTTCGLSKAGEELSQ